MTIPIDTYTHVAMYRLSTYGSLWNIRSEFKRWTVKNIVKKWTFWRKLQNFPLFKIFSIRQPLLRYILHCGLIGMHMPAYVVLATIPRCTYFRWTMRRYVLTTCENKQVNYEICICVEFKTSCSWFPLAYATQLPMLYTCYIYTC